MATCEIIKDHDALQAARDKLGRATGRAELSNAVQDMFTAFEREVADAMPFNTTDFRLDLRTVRDDLLRLLDTEFDWLESPDGRAATEADHRRDMNR